MGDTEIEWTDKTWNPVRGCDEVSPECENCYAKGMAARFSGPGQPYEGLARFSPKNRTPQWTGKVRFVPGMLDQPLRWREPKRIFVNSMSDLFHEGLSNEEIAAVFGVMAAAPRHTFQVLTKRPQRTLEWFRWVSSQTIDGGDTEVRVCIGAADRLVVRGFHVTYPTWPLPNVHIGVSAGTQKSADNFIPKLLKIPAAIRFVSAEPLLERVDLSEWIAPISCCSTCDEEHHGHVDGNCPSCGRDDLITVWGDGQLRRWRDGERTDEDRDGPPLSWVIAGAESGSGARSMNDDWVRLLRDQCANAFIQFFFKQRIEAGKKVGLPMLDGRQHAEFPEVSR